MKSRYHVLAFLFVLLPFNSVAERLHSEAWYVETFCPTNPQPIRLEDGTFADCITEHVVYEFDFGNKWYEATGQSFHYSDMTGKLPGIYLIIESAKDEKYLRKLYRIIFVNKLPIQVKVLRMYGSD